jgi:hypothetical protein
MRRFAFPLSDWPRTVVTPMVIVDVAAWAVARGDSERARPSSTSKHPLPVSDRKAAVTRAARPVRMTRTRAGRKGSRKSALRALLPDLSRWNMLYLLVSLTSPLT